MIPIDTIGDMRRRIEELKKDRDRWRATAEKRLQKMVEFGARIEAAKGDET